MVQFVNQLILFKDDLTVIHLFLSFRQPNFWSYNLLNLMNSDDYTINNGVNH